MTALTDALLIQMPTNSSNDVDVPETRVAISFVETVALVMAELLTLTNGDLLMGASAVSNTVRSNTADASDNGSMALCGGGAAATTRGAFIRAYGNEHANVGALDLFAGNVTGGHVDIHTGAGVLRLRITDAGVVEIANGLTVGSTVIGSSIGGANDSAFQAISTDPAFMLKETGASLDSKIWDLTARSDQLLLRLVNDAASVATTLMTFNRSGTTPGQIIVANDFDIIGALSKGSGTFLIDHPLDPENKDLFHGFVEAPRYDLIYRGRATLVNGKATVSIDAESNMTGGTFEALTQNVQVTSLQNNEGWEPVKGHVEGGTLHIECKDLTSTDTIDWVVIGERADAFIKSHKGNDDDGHLLVEVEKEILDPSLLEDREVESEKVASDILEAVEEARGKKGYVRHKNAYPEFAQLPTRTVKTRVQVVEEVI